ncbi:MAG: lipoyl(octanoyl) transferase LipB [Phycisphaerae bacterium]|nr:lipoyl(octanoyl) transferase LipB [Saprospiraceae bacterium]
MQTVQFQDLGLMRYQTAWDYQTAVHRRLVENKLNNRDLPPKSYPQEHQLLFVEHPPVYTLGKSGSMENLLLSEAELAERGIEFFPINRGGDITFHGPGQIVGYPILDLECFFTDVHRYVRNIEEVIIRTIAEYGIEGFRIKDYTGVWTLDDGRWTLDSRPANIQYPMSKVQSPPPNVQRKICAIGVHLSRWTTLHGWAFNVNTPLEYFDHIVPCGIADEDKTVTSLAQLLGHEVDMGEVKEKLKCHFGEVFECEVVG